MKHTDIDHLLIDAIDCARRAGTVALSYFRGGRQLDIHTKSGESDIVTAADKASEAVIKDFIATHYPDHAILSEESGESGGDAPWRWVIDPVDGTTNFSTGLPFWAISIGIEYEGEAVIGVVYVPFTDELFHAVKGGGAYLNGKQLHVSTDENIAHAVVTTGFPVDKDVNPDNNLDNVAAVLPLVRGLRRLGAASVDMCYVAAGFLGAYWELNLHEWDVCASTLIVTEAGGRCTRFRHDRNVSLLCGAPAIHDRILPLLSSEPRG